MSIVKNTNNTTQVWKIGDCLDIMPSITTKSIDLVLSDPPYGVGMDYGKYYIDSFDNWKKLINRFVPEALRVGKCVLISTSKIEGEEYLFKHFPPVWRVCWYKGACGTRSPIGFKDWETIFVYGHVKKNTHDYFAVHANHIRTKILGHPCPKTMEWAIWLIEHFTDEYDIVLDPFLGSGTTLKACRLTNRNGIGYEINPEYEPLIKEYSMKHYPSLESYL